MTLRQQQVAVFLATVTVIFGLFAAGVWLIAQRLTTEATLQTALVMARQVEIALADSLRARPDAAGSRRAATDFGILELSRQHLPRCGAKGYSCAGPRTVAPHRSERTDPGLC